MSFAGAGCACSVEQRGPRRRVAGWRSALVRRLVACQQAADAQAGLTANELEEAVELANAGNAGRLSHVRADMLEQRSPRTDDPTRHRHAVHTVQAPQLIDVQAIEEVLAQKTPLARGQRR